MAPMKVLEGLPEGWSQEQCATCKMVFAFPPLDEGSGIKAKDILGEELDRHIQQNHIDLPSAWKAEESNNVSIRRSSCR
jgi:hypothetical protein